MEDGEPHGVVAAVREGGASSAGGGNGGCGDLELLDPAEDADGSPSPSSAAERWRAEASWAFQHYLDRAAPHTAGRWAGTLLAAAVSALRVYYAQGFYVVSYGLGIYLLNLLIGFLSPMVDPELEALDAAGPALPTRLLPEFKFWYGAPSLITMLFPSPPLPFVYREFIRDHALLAPDPTNYMQENQ
ncbi:hypothetical protein ACQ4PT_051551 [Festuca glaucescens]